MDSSLQGGTEDDYRTSHGLLDLQVYRTPVPDLAELQERIYAVNNVMPQMLHNTWVEVEYRLGISLATNGSHVEIYGTYGKEKSYFSLFVAIDFIYRFALVKNL